MTRFIYWVLMLIPSLFLFAILTFVIVIKISASQASIDEIINSKRHPENFYKTAISLPVPPETTDQSVIHQIAKIDDRSVVVLGGSSLVLPGHCNFGEDNGIVFPSKLKQILDTEGYKVINFGRCGYETSDILDLVSQIFAKATPRLVIFYGGHNNYSNSVRSSILDKHYTLGRFFSVTGSYFAFQYSIKDRLETFLFRWIHFFFPSYLNVDDFKKFNSMITQNMTDDLRVIIEIVKRNNSKLLLIPAIGNLSYRQHNAPLENESEFQKAMDTNDLQRLLMVSENDNWNYDRRIKVEGARAILDLENKKEGIYVLDIASILFKKNSIDLYKKYFSDIFHFTNEGHEFVAKQIIQLRM